MTGTRWMLRATTLTNRHAGAAAIEEGSTAVSLRRRAVQQGGLRQEVTAEWTVVASWKTVRDSRHDSAARWPANKASRLRRLFTVRKKSEPFEKTFDSLLSY
jgi:hypothetical protein